MEYDEEGMAEVLMDENAIANVASQYSSCTKAVEITFYVLFSTGPGTSLARPVTGSTTSQGIRCVYCGMKYLHL